MSQSLLRKPSLKQAGVYLHEFAIVAVILVGLLAAAVKLHHHYIGPVFLHPGTREAAHQMVRATFADVTNLGEPVISGERTITLSATIGQKACEVQLYSPEKLTNDYGWTLKKSNCGEPSA